MSVMTYGAASAAALAEEMRRDQAVWALGEDLGLGGVFGQYTGLRETFGPERIVDTPISESAIMGASVGAALVGTRPVVEMRFSDFALCAVDELVNQAAKARYMLGGQAKVPLVVRQPIGIGRNSAAQHSQSLEAWYAHIPGLVVAVPSTPENNKGLLKSAIRCNDPVVFMEHKALWQLEGEVSDDEDLLVPFGKAEQVAAGDDLTIVTWSAMRHTAAAAVSELTGMGVNADLLDLRTLWPWDRDAVVASARRTGRLLVVHEAVSVAGFGGEVLASVVEDLDGDRAIHARRLAAPRVPAAYAPLLEREICISKQMIIDVATRMVARN